MFDFLVHGWRWILGAFSFGCSLTLLLLVCYAVLWGRDSWFLWRVRHRTRARRVALLDVDSWMRRAPDVIQDATSSRVPWAARVLEPWLGYTLTVLDEHGRALFSSHVEADYHVKGEVRATGVASRFALLRAGVVVREGPVKVARHEYAPDLTALECCGVDWPAGAPVLLRLSPEWFKSDTRSGR